MQPYYTVMRLPGEQQDRVHPDAAVHAPAEGEPGGLDGGAERRRRTTASCSCSSSRSRRSSSGPKQIVGKINQDEVISPQITLWNQQGSRVIWGTLLVIPDQRVAALRAAAVPAVAGSQDSRAEAGHRRVPEPDRDGRNADARARSHLRAVGHRRAGARPAVEQRHVRRHDDAGRRQGACEAAVEPGPTPGRPIPRSRPSIAEMSAHLRSGRQGD